VTWEDGACHSRLIPHRRAVLDGTSHTPDQPDICFDETHAIANAACRLRARPPEGPKGAVVTNALPREIAEQINLICRFHVDSPRTPAAAHSGGSRTSRW